MGHLGGSLTREEPHVAVVLHILDGQRPADQGAFFIDGGEHSDVGIVDDVRDLADACRFRHAVTSFCSVPFSAFAAGLSLNPAYW
ncbi:hypothetical protein D9M69_690760 [compost metagenome]